MLLKCLLATSDHDAVWSRTSPNNNGGFDIIASSGFAEHGYAIHRGDKEGASGLFIGEVKPTDAGVYCCTDSDGRPPGNCTELAVESNINFSSILNLFRLHYFITPHRQRGGGVIYPPRGVK